MKTHKIHLTLLLAVAVSFAVTFVLSNPVPQSDHSHHHHHHSTGAEEGYEDDDYYDYYYEEGGETETAPPPAGVVETGDGDRSRSTAAGDGVVGDTAQGRSEHPPHHHHHEHEMTMTKMPLVKDDREIPIDTDGLAKGVAESSQDVEILPVPLPLKSQGEQIMVEESGSLPENSIDQVPNSIPVEAEGPSVQMSENHAEGSQPAVIPGALPVLKGATENEPVIPDSILESEIHPELSVNSNDVVPEGKSLEDPDIENEVNQKLPSISDTLEKQDGQVLAKDEISNSGDGANPVKSSGNVDIPADSVAQAALAVPLVATENQETVNPKANEGAAEDVMLELETPENSLGSLDIVLEAELPSGIEPLFPAAANISQNGTSSPAIGDAGVELGTVIGNITKTENPMIISPIARLPTPPVTQPTPPSPTLTEKTPISSGVLKLDKSCAQLPVTGMCRGAFPMFYFDPKTLQCKQFVYGGCRGNENIHRTAEDCYKKCYPAGMKKSATDISTKVSQNGYLTIRSGTGASILTFTGKEAAAKIDPPVLTDFTISGVYAFKLHFRTDRPHGFIAFLRQVEVPEEVKDKRIQLLIYLKKGHLGVTHIFDGKTETFMMRRGGLQGGNWHSASVKVDSSNGELTINVDDQQEYFTIGALGLRPHYGGRTLGGFQSVLWVGGVFDNEVISEEMTFGIEPFHGCIQHLSLSSGPTSEEMVAVKPLVATRHTGVREHCANNCNDRFRNLCSRKSHCVEHFDHSTCDCFNSGQDGPKCKNPDIPVLSLNGDGHVVHRLYEWMDRVHSYTNRISVAFKTRFADSILLYASAEHPERQYIAASLTQSGTIYVEVNLGAGAVSAEIGEGMDAEVWHTLNIIHQHEKIDLYIDSRQYTTLILPGDIQYFHLDPDFYVGNAPHLSRACGLPLDTGRSDSGSNGGSGLSCGSNSGYRYHYDKNTGSCLPFNYTGCGGNANMFDNERSCLETCYTPGLRSFNAFMGCMQNVFFNDISILQSLKEKNRTTRYVGSTEEPSLGTSCNDTKFLSVTFSTERAAMTLMNPEPNFHLALSFRPTKPKGVLASGEVELQQYESVGNWEIRHDSHHVYFYIHDNLLTLKSEAKIRLGNWQYVEVQYKSGRVNMMVNNKKQGKEGPGKLVFSPEVTVGKNALEEFPGFIGCIRKLIIGSTQLDLRTIVGTPMVNKGVTYDNCQVLGPCEGPQACEHGGKCSVDENDEVQCDCSGTGYSGKRCHFSLYKKSCEQYRQLGLKSSGVYRIDLDGNGPLPPAYVKCSFNSLLRETYTTVEHNVEEEYEVRRRGIKDFKLDVQYRDFTPEMLTTLVSQSKSCSQEVEYQCRRAPLKLSTQTWFSSPAQKFLSNFGTKAPGVCKCRERNSCERRDVACNCDINDGLLRKDKGTFTDPEQLPITSMVFLQGEVQKVDSEAHITLKPLTCISEASTEQAVSFMDSSSYLEVPAWREGSLSFSFRTTSETAVVAYQPAYHPRHATFMISLVGGKELEFMYRYQGEAHYKTLRSLKPLNDGEWQHVLVDVYNHQLRFVINSEEEIIAVDPNAYLGVLDGSMFLGGIPEQFRGEEKHSQHVKLEGLVGCIKGLALNGDKVSLERLFRASSHGVSLGCNPACDLNPCQNGARCVEMWGSYKCECANAFAHSGKNCEININTESLTFMTEESKYKYFDNDTVHRGEKLFNETFYLNFRTHEEKGLLIFAYNYLHNFAQLHLARPNEVVFLFNYGREVKKMSVVANDGVVFNKGQSVQVKVLRTNTSTSLHVFTEGNYFKESLKVGFSLLQEDDYEQFPFGDSQPLPEMVYYPHSMTKPRPFLLVYLGSANDRQHDIRSTIPGFRGCIRGVKIGDTLMPLRKMLATSAYSTEGIAPECKMACDTKPCLNGGKCTEDFQFFSNFHCECKDTSYTGATCDSEIAYTFSGNEWIKQDTSYSPLDGDFTLELAFSTSERLLEPQAVALLRSTNPSSVHDYVLIWIGADGSIVVEAQLQDIDEDKIHGAKVRPSEHSINAFDGQRHYILVQKKGRRLTTKIDKKEREVGPMKSVYVSETPVKATPTSLYLGGIESAIDDRMMQYKGFHGCISNVRISTPKDEYHPLRQYSDGDLHLEKKGIPKQGQCAGFGLAGLSFPMLVAQALTMGASAVKGSDWVYTRPEKIPMTSVSYVKGHPERDTVFDNVVPTVAGIVLGASLIIVALLLLKQYMKRKKEGNKEKKEEEEKKPLFNGRNAKISYEPRKNTMVITSDNQESVPLKSAPDGIPLTSYSVVKEEIHQNEKPAAAPLEAPLSEIEPAEQEPHKGQDDVPEVSTTSSDEKVSHEDDVDVDIKEEVQVHSDAGGDSDEVQVLDVSGEVATAAPTSNDNNTDTVQDDSDPEPVLKKYVIIGAEEDDARVQSEQPQPSEHRLDVDQVAHDPEPENDDSKQQEDRHLDIDTNTAPVVPAVDAGAQSEQPETSEEIVHEGEPAAGDLKQEEDSKVEIDFSSVPVIKIERSQSEADVIVDDDVDDDAVPVTENGDTEESAESVAAALKIGNTEAIVESGPKSEAEEVTSKAEIEEEESASPDSEVSDGTDNTPPAKGKKEAEDVDFIEYRDDSVQVQDAQRMSKTMAELEAPSVIACDDSSVELDAATKPEPKTQSTGNVGSASTGLVLEQETETKTGSKENVLLSVTEKENDAEGRETLLQNSERERNLLLKNEENTLLSEEETSSEVNKDIDTDVKECGLEGKEVAVHTSEKQGLKDQQITDELTDANKRTSQNFTEDELDLLKQWSAKQRSRSEGDASLYKVSFSSDDADDDPTYHTYINYALDDSDVMQDLTDPPHLAGPLIHHEDAAHLAPIQESDETDEDDLDSDKKISMPSLLKSNLSAGMLNLNAISSDSREELDVTTVGKGEGEKSEEPSNEDTEIRREISTGDEREPLHESAQLIKDEQTRQPTMKDGREAEEMIPIDSLNEEKLLIVENGTILPSNEEDKIEQLLIVEGNTELPPKDVEQLLIVEDHTDILPKGEEKAEQLLIVEGDTELTSKDDEDQEERQPGEEGLPLKTEIEVDRPIGKDSEENPVKPGEEGQPSGASATDREIDGRLKKGRITKGKKDSPIFLSENLRTFSNPISYLGGPTIEYDEDTREGRTRQDSLTSLTSLD
ncbi:axotactin-like isoform X4 [Macrobrachium nipponense]|uniref:axotactin-like isoform X4 n=1 Tax=Macrobrachium nipponense TaxID=159736 RepID=UPI0030C7A377